MSGLSSMQRQSNRQRGTGAAFLGAASFIFILAAAPAHAQSDLQSLSDKVDRLQQELSDVERQVYNGQVPEGGLPAGTAGGTGSAASASQEVRIQQLETQLSDITGQIEQLNYKLQQLSTRLDKMSQDVDFRLTALEHGGQPGAAAGVSANGVPANGVPATGVAAAGVPTGGVPAGGSDQQTTIISGAGTNTQPPLQPPLQPGSQPLDPNAPLKQSSLVPTTLGAEASGAPPPATNQTAAATPDTGGAYQLPGNTVEAQYEYAFNLLRQANYAEAEKALTAFIQQHPQDPLAGNAQYWLGETYYVRGRYQDAAVAFAEAYQKYPNSQKAPDNLLKLGMSLGQIGKKSDACVAFGELGKKFPGASDNLKERLKQEKHRYGCS